MTTRYTRKDADAAFSRLCEAFDLQTGPAYIDGKANVGAHLLQPVPMHRQYRVIRMGEHGSEWNPFGFTSYTAEEFVHMVGFAIDLKNYDQESFRG
jgi:hypothetical protein